MGINPCADEDPCTSDECSIVYCIDDGVGGETCAEVDNGGEQQFSCNDGSAVVCDDDNNACTIDACDSATGGCYTEIVCDDENPCSVDTCDPDSGCVFEGALCDDGNACTSDECVQCDPINGCAEGEVEGCKSTPIECEAPNACSSSFCNPETGGCDIDVVDCAVSYTHLTLPTIYSV